MPNPYINKDLSKLKRLATLAKMYKGDKKTGVSTEYMRQLRDRYNVEAALTIDGISFYDLDTLPPEIKDRLEGL